MRKTNLKCGKLKGKSRVYMGTKLCTSGIQTNMFFQERDFTGTFPPIPVQWRNGIAHLHIRNYAASVPCNQNASDLITHPGFNVRGEALVITGHERWHGFRVEGNEQNARSLLEHLEHTFREPEHVLYMPSGHCNTHTYIYVRNDHDAVIVRDAV